MTKRSIIDKTLEVIHKLPEDKINEVSDFADFLFKKYEDKLVLDNISAIVGESESFNFLNEDENLYSLKDLKFIFNEKG